MTTSGQTSSVLTAGDFIGEALEHLRVIGLGEVAVAAEESGAIRQLNFMLKAWQADGCHFWREQEGSMSVSSAETTLSTRVIDIMEARVSVNGAERPLARWEWGEYVQIPNKAAVGSPIAFTVRKDRDATRIKVWPVPSSPTTINYTAARVIEDVTAASETLDVPQEWTDCVIYNLAVRLVTKYGGVDRPEFALVKAMADDLYRQMRDLDRPASVFFK